MEKENQYNSAIDLFLDETLLENENELEYINTLLSYNPFSFKNISYVLKLYHSSLETPDEKMSSNPLFHIVLDMKKPLLKIGRGEKNDWILEFLQVSREHARIFLEFDKVYLITMSQKNPVFYGLNQNIDYILNNEDEIRIGYYFMKFYISGDKVQYSIFHDESDTNSAKFQQIAWKSGGFLIGKHLFENKKKILENHAKLTLDKGVMKICVNQSSNTFLSLQNPSIFKGKRLELDKKQYLYFGESLYVLTCEQIINSKKN